MKSGLTNEDFIEGKASHEEEELGIAHGQGQITELCQPDESREKCNVEESQETTQELRTDHPAEIPAKILENVCHEEPRAGFVLRESRETTAKGSSGKRRLNSLPSKVLAGGDGAGHVPRLMDAV
jgi:hypothetical protein